MERLHLNDFCDLVGGEATNINPLHVAAPPPFHKPIQPVYDRDGSETAESKQARQDRKRLESLWEEREHSWFYTRPWVCDVKEYNFTMINTFTWVSHADAGCRHRKVAADSRSSIGRAWRTWRLCSRLKIFFTDHVRHREVHTTLRPGARG